MCSHSTRVDLEHTKTTNNTRSVDHSTSNFSASSKLAGSQVNSNHLCTSDNLASTSPATRRSSYPPAKYTTQTPHHVLTSSSYNHDGTLNARPISESRSPRPLSETKQKHHHVDGPGYQTIRCENAYVTYSRSCSRECLKCAPPEKEVPLSDKTITIRKYQLGKWQTSNPRSGRERQIGTRNGSAPYSKLTRSRLNSSSQLTPSKRGITARKNTENRARLHPDKTKAQLKSGSTTLSGQVTKMLRELRAKTTGKQPEKPSTETQDPDRRFQEQTSCGPSFRETGTSPHRDTDRILTDNAKEGRQDIISDQVDIRWVFSAFSKTNLYSNHVQFILSLSKSERRLQSPLLFWKNSSIPLNFDFPSDYVFPTISSTFRKNNPYLAYVYDCITFNRKLNFQGEQVPITSHWNLPFFMSQCTHPLFQEIMSFLLYGFPIGIDFSLKPTGDQFDHPEWKKKKTINHGSATRYPEQVKSHLDNEVKRGTLLGPFSNPPFSYTHISAMMSREKRGTDERRVIDDFKMPQGASVNSMAHDDLYLSREFSLKLPSPVDLIQLLLSEGQGCQVATFDFSKAFRQVGVCPSSLPWVNVTWDDKFYTENCLVYGQRHAMFIQQNVSNCIAHVLHIDGYKVLIYCDDGICVLPKGTAGKTIFKKIFRILGKIGVRLSKLKTIEPTHSLVWIGIEVDTIDFIIRIPEEKIDKAIILVTKWLKISEATLLEWQQLSGKLHYVSSCCPGARHFLSRIYDKVALATRTGTAAVDFEVRKDLAWFAKFLKKYNGKHFIKNKGFSFTIGTDASLRGGGGNLGKEAFTFNFSPDLLQLSNSINQLEAFTILAALRLWSDKLKGTNILILCDNKCTIASIQSGRAKDHFMRRIIREIWYTVTTNDITFSLQYIRSAEHVIPDRLSRGMLSPVDYNNMIKTISENNLNLIKILPQHVQLPDPSL